MTSTVSVGFSQNGDLNEARYHHRGARPVHLDQVKGVHAVVPLGVPLAPRTIVGTGSVATEPFPKGNSIIAGNPARVIKRNTP